MLDLEAVLFELGLEPTYMGNRYAAPCPFTEHEHDASHPGFSVFADSGSWICFKGCGQGSLEFLVQRIKEATPEEAKRWLSSRGEEVSLEKVIQSALPKEAVVYEQDLTHLVWDYDRQETTRTSSYILERGFTAGTLREWGFRYDPELKAIVIPLYDITGTRLVGVQRRETPGNPLPVNDKYMWTPGSRKGDHLFGAHKHPRNTGYTLLVEGTLDAVWLHQEGWVSAVALMGATCAHAQVRLLAQLGGRVVLAMDSDEAGQRARIVVAEQLSGYFDVVHVEWSSEGAKDAQELNREQLRRVFQKVRYGWTSP